MSNPTLYRQVTRAAWLGLVVNAALAVAKFVGGVVSGSIALVSAAVESAVDVVSSVVTLLALYLAQQPADREHPYGHTRAEAIAASNVALLIILSALVVGWQAIAHFSAQHTTVPVWTLWLAGVNFVVKEGLYQYKSRVADAHDSQSIRAGAWDHRGDAFTSLAVLVGLAAVRFGGATFWWADEAAALVVVAVIMASGIVLFQRSVVELMDPQASAELVEQIRGAARAVDQVRDVETLWVRKSGLEYFADIHVEVDPNLTVEEGHRIGHAVKDRLLAQFPALRDVLVHLEPARANRLGKPLQPS